MFVVIQFANYQIVANNCNSVSFEISKTLKLLTLKSFSFSIFLFKIFIFFSIFYKNFTFFENLFCFRNRIQDAFRAVF